MKNVILFGFAFLFLISCSNDDSSVDRNLDPVVAIAGYKITSDTNELDWKVVTIGEVINNKLVSETKENFQAGLSQGAPSAISQYFYDGEVLASTIVHHSTSVGNIVDTKYFFYDSEQNLVGINWEYGEDTSYYRCIHVSNTVVYFEKITLPYDNSSAQVQHRNIIEFDQNDNVIKAGRDNDLDEVTDSQYQYFYANGNLMSVQKPNGTVQAFVYSNVVDNFSILKENSYGKKVLGLLNSEGYAHFFEDDINRQSRNLLTEDLLAETYEVLENNYYKKKTLVQYLEGFNLHNVTVTEFFFN